MFTVKQAGNYGLFRSLEVVDVFEINGREVDRQTAIKLIREAMASGKYINGQEHVLENLLTGKELAQIRQTKAWPIHQIDFGECQVTMVMPQQPCCMPSRRTFQVVPTNTNTCIESVGRNWALEQFRIDRPRPEPVVMRLHIDNVYMTDVVFRANEKTSKLMLGGIPKTYPIRLKCPDKMDVAVEYIECESHPVERRVYSYIRTYYNETDTLLLDREELCEVEILKDNKGDIYFDDNLFPAIMLENKTPTTVMAQIKPADPTIIHSGEWVTKVVAPPPFVARVISAFVFPDHYDGP